MDVGVAQVVLAVGRLAAGNIQLLGTAFPVTQNRLATTAHVTGPIDENLCVIAPRIARLDDYQDTTNHNVHPIGVKLAAYDPVGDISILEPLTSSNFQFPYKLTGSDEIPTGTAIVTVGYPHADHGRLVLTEQHSRVGARVILGSNGVKHKHVILNIQTRPGQSGSPVFTENGRAVAAMIIGSYAPGRGGAISLGGIDPSTLHQTTHAVSAEYISELLR